MTNEQKATAKKAASLIRKGWVRNSLAVDKNYKFVDPGKKEAANFCALGALIHSSKNNNDVQHIAQLFGIKVGMSMTRYNDFRAKSAEDVAKVFDQISEENFV